MNVLLTIFSPLFLDLSLLSFSPSSLLHPPPSLPSAPPLPPPHRSSGHQQSVQLSEGGPPAAPGPGGQEAGPLPGVRSCRPGAAGLCVRTGGPLARLHLVNTLF